MTAAESHLADAARQADVTCRAMLLATWLAESGPRKLTDRGVLRKPDVPAAVSAIGTKLPAKFRSASDITDLHRAWLFARAAGFVTVRGGRVTAKSDVASGEAGAFLSQWLDALVACAAAEHKRYLGPVEHLLADLRAARERPGTRQWVRCRDELADFGAIAPSGDVTPLGRWAMKRLDDRLPVMSPKLTAAEMLSRLTRFDQVHHDKMAWQWIQERDPVTAVREILRASASMSPRMRWLAGGAAELAGEDALPAWREVLDEPLLAVHARCVMIAWDEAPPLTAAELRWLAVEAAASGLEEGGPDEAMCVLRERLSGVGIDDLLAGVRASGHPAAEEVAAAVTELAISGAPLTVNQGMQLKVQLWRWSPPIWRSVIVPSSATLAALHVVIQILFGWDGDHLHAFEIAGRRYSDPYFNLEETGAEEMVRLRDAFPGKAKVSYEYDFGASWMHEITLEKTLPLDPAVRYPVCVAFKGESPDEYDNEEWRPRRRKPYSLRAVNARLAKLTG